LGVFTQGKPGPSGGGLAWAIFGNTVGVEEGCRLDGPSRDERLVGQPFPAVGLPMKVVLLDIFALAFKLESGCPLLA